MGLLEKCKICFADVGGDGAKALQADRVASAVAVSTVCITLGRKWFGQVARFRAPEPPGAAQAYASLSLAYGPTAWRLPGTLRNAGRRPHAQHCEHGSLCLSKEIWVVGEQASARDRGMGYSHHAPGRSRSSREARATAGIKARAASESGEIGRRTRLRIWRVTPWGFESPLSHQTSRWLAVHHGGVVYSHYEFSKQPANICRDPGRQLP